MKKIEMKYATREQWLEAAVSLMGPLFSKAGYKEIPKVRVSCGWPSTRGISAKRAALGECWDKSAASDAVAQVFISPRLKDPLNSYGVLPVLAHEVCHAVVGNKAKHGKVFRKCAVGIGLQGKMTSTEGGEGFLAEAKEWVKLLGEYPHAILNPNGRPTKKQTTRMIKCECEQCGYQVRTSRKWLDQAGAPLCPCNQEPMKYEVPDELKGDDDDE